jgi:manganese transport protein
MGKFSISNSIKFLAWGIAALLVYLNVRYLYEEGSGFFGQPGQLFWKSIILLLGLGAILLLGYIFFLPWFTKKQPRVSIQIHPQPESLGNFEIPSFRNIAIALDFSEHDEKLLAYAIGQGNRETRFILIHVVESASARMLGKESDDYETRRDEEQLDLYRIQLQAKGFQSISRLGYRNRTREIVRIVREEKADMLVIGSHGHTGLKDFIYGETVNSVRHELKIPVLIVNI